MELANARRPPKTACHPHSNRVLAQQVYDRPCPRKRCHRQAGRLSALKCFWAHPDTDEGARVCLTRTLGKQGLLARQAPRTAVSPTRSDPPDCKPNPPTHPPTQCAHPLPFHRQPLPFIEEQVPKRFTQKNRSRRGNRAALCQS